jgi:hypothetical protein
MFDVLFDTFSSSPVLALTNCVGIRNLTEFPSHPVLGGANLDRLDPPNCSEIKLSYHIISLRGNLDGHRVRNSQR